MTKALSNFCHPLLDQILNDCAAQPESLIELLNLLQRLQSPVADLAAVAGGIPWVAELTQQAAAWLENSDRYLAWIEILAEISEEELVPSGAGGTTRHPSGFAAIAFARGSGAGADRLDPHPYCPAADLTFD